MAGVQALVETDYQIVPAAATVECNTISGKTLQVFARLA